MTGAPRAVIFDAGGVLMLPDPEAVRSRLAPFGVRPDDEACRRGHYLATAVVDRLGSAEYLAADRRIAAHLGIAEPDVEAAVAALAVVYTEDPWVPVPGVAQQLLRLQQAGLRLAVVSNATGRVEQELAGHRICSVGGEECATVDVVVDSHVVGVEKPDPAIFAFALDALDLPAEECVYVGDSTYFDVAGAVAAGIPPVHVTPYGECPDGGHPHVESVRHFADVLLGASAPR